VSICSCNRSRSLVSASLLASTSLQLASFSLRFARSCLSVRRAASMAALYASLAGLSVLVLRMTAAITDLCWTMHSRAMWRQSDICLRTSSAFWTRNVCSRNLAKNSCTCCYTSLIALIDTVWAAASPQSYHKRQQNKRTPGVPADEATRNGLISYGYRNTEPILVLNPC
jgi:hypothetical protein